MAERQIHGKKMLVYLGTGSSTVTDITIEDGGAGYDSAPTISFTGGGGGSGAAATANMTGGAGAQVVSSITITNPGSGYTTPPTVVFSGGTPSTPAQAEAEITETFELVVCMTSHDLDQTSSTVSTDTFCGKITVDGTKDAKFTFNNVVTLSPDSGKVSLATLQALYLSGDNKNWKVTTEDLDPGDPIWTFAAFIESLKVSANATDLYNSSISLQIDENGADLDIAV